MWGGGCVGWVVGGVLGGVAWGGGQTSVAEWEDAIARKKAVDLYFTELRPSTRYRLDTSPLISARAMLGARSIRCHTPVSRSEEGAAGDQCILIRRIHHWRAREFSARRIAAAGPRFVRHASCAMLAREAAALCAQPTKPNVVCTLYSSCFASRTNFSSSWPTALS